MANLRPLQLGGTIDLETIPEVQRKVALTICVASAMDGPWWNYVSAAREVLRIVRDASPQDFV